VKPSAVNPSRLNVWGVSLLNKLPSRSRNARKRHASKLRRRLLSSAPTALQSQSILALQEDGVLYVFDSAEHATFQVEALDAESTFREIFDTSAERYRINWLTPNERSRFTAVNGTYELSPTGERAPSELIAAIRGASAIDPRPNSPTRSTISPAA